MKFDDSGPSLQSDNLSDLLGMLFQLAGLALAGIVISLGAEKLGEWAEKRKFKRLRQRGQKRGEPSE